MAGPEKDPGQGPETNTRDRRRGPVYGNGEANRSPYLMAEATSQRRAIGPAATLVTMAALLLLDGQLGPLSFSLRRAAALSFLYLIVASRWPRTDQPEAVRALGDTSAVSPARTFPSGAAPNGDSRHVSGILSRGICRQTAWATAVVAATVAFARIPSVAIGLVGLVVACAAIEVASGLLSRGARCSPSPVPACLSYVAFRFAVDLVPQAGRIVDTVARNGSRYCSYARGVEFHQSFTALGGPAVALSVLHLLWCWRQVGGFGRLIGAGGATASLVFPVARHHAWSRSRTAIGVLLGPRHGLCWLIIAVLANAVLAGRRRSLVSAPPPAAHRSLLAGACLCSTVAGACIVGAGLAGPAASARSAFTIMAGSTGSDRFLAASAPSTEGCSGPCQSTAALKAMILKSSSTRKRTSRPTVNPRRREQRIPTPTQGRRRAKATRVSPQLRTGSVS